MLRRSSVSLTSTSSRIAAMATAAGWKNPTSSGIPEEEMPPQFNANAAAAASGATPSVADGNGKYKRNEFWEWEGPTPEHRSLVVLLYRNILKGLLNMKTIRRRSLTIYTRMSFRRRATATEKLLIDECIEEARRAAYIIQKNVNLSNTNEYEFDTMNLPKDTGQDVKTFMEDHYDPQVSRSQFEHIKDVEPGKEKYHNQRLAANDGYAQKKFQEGTREATKNMPNIYGTHVSDEAKQFRPPPPKF